MKFKPSHTPGNLLVELEEKDSLPFLSAGSGKISSPLFKLKNILVPTDFSDCSKKALAYALPYAREFGAQITLLYVAQFYYAASEMDSAEAPELEGKHLERAKDELAKLAKSLPSSVKAETAVVSGKIIGTHGAMKMQHGFLGSTAERVARYADCPVLIVRERERDFVAIDRPNKNGRKVFRERSAK